MRERWQSKFVSEKGEAEWGIFILVAGLFAVFSAFLLVSGCVHDSKIAAKAARKEALRMAQEENNPVYRGPDGYQVFCKRSKVFNTITGRSCIY